MYYYTVTWLGILKGGHYPEYLNVDESIILKWIFGLHKGQYIS
jgi:hypothetical protein